MKNIIRKIILHVAALPLIIIYKIIGPPRILHYRSAINKILLKAFDANVSDTNVRAHSPIVLHGFLETGDYRHLTLSANCLLNGNNYLDISSPIILEEGVSLGPGVTIMTHNSYNENYYLIELLKHTCGRAPVRIKKGAGIKAHALIVHGVTIGENAVVGGNAVVNRDVPDNCFVAGIPAKVIKVFDNPPSKDKIEQSV